MSKNTMTQGQMRKKYAEFCNAIEKVVPKLKKEIEDKKTIYIPARDIAKDIPEFRDKHILNFYMGTKFCLWDKGIFVMGKTKDHEPIFQMRARTKEDKFFKVFK